MTGRKPVVERAGGSGACLCLPSARRSTASREAYEAVSVAGAAGIASVDSGRDGWLHADHYECAG